MISSLIDGLITFAGGVWCAFIGFGVVAISKDRGKTEEWYQKWGVFMKIAGPLLAAWGLFIILRDVL